MYDDAGRLASSRPEPEWDEQQQDLMLALIVYERNLCPNCGRPLSVCTDPKSEGKWQVPPPTRCHATTALAIAQEAHQGAPNPGALLWSAQMPNP
jgi:hypothetical protein